MVESTLGEGTTVIIQLPLEEGTSPLQHLKARDLSL